MPEPETTPDLPEEFPPDQEDLEGGDEGDLNAPFSGKVLLEKADRSLSELHCWHNSGQIILDPEWQRNYVWDRG